ncbi:MAG: PAS domain S-box protein [Isosphaeraceae bacterium]|nr:PAS domain S-box protein [Isosphaeraceae bacterium]
MNPSHYKLETTDAERVKALPLMDVDRLIGLLPSLVGATSRPSATRVYLLPMILAIVGLTARWLLRDRMPNIPPFGLLFPMVLLSAFFGGGRAGLIATAVGFLGALTLFKLDPFTPASSVDRIVSIIFLTISIGSSILAEAMHRAGYRLLVATRTLREREKRLRLALESSRDSLWDWDLETGQVFRSEGWRRLRGFSDEAAGSMSEDWLTFLHPDDVDAARKAFFDHLEGKTPHYRVEYRVRTIDGEERWILDRGEAIRDEEGRPIRVTGFETDITGIKAVQTELSEAHRRLDQIIATATDSILSIDVDDRIVMMNPAAERLMGVKASDAIGKPILPFLPERYRDDRSTWFGANPESCVPSRKSTARGVIRAADGRELSVEGSMGQVGVGERQVTTWILRDVTPRLRAEKLLARQAAALEKLANGASLSDVLDFVCRTAEELIDECRCSVMLVEGDGLLHMASAPGIPASFTDALAMGVPVGPEIGSCGSAVALGRSVIAEDISSDPRWVNYAALVLENGLAACWSTPIFDSKHEAIGSFGIYYATPRRPSQEDQELIEVIAHLVGIAVESTRARDALEKSEERQRLALEAGRLGTWWHDPSSRFVHLDRRAAAQMGFVSTEVSYEELLDRIHPEDRERIAGSIRRSHDPSQGKGVFIEEERVILPDGSVRWLAVYARVYFQGFGESRRPRLVVGANQDITERKLVEIKLRENDRRKDEFLAMLAHELRNPLAAISNAVAIQALDRSTPDDLSWSRDVIGWQTKHLSRLVDDLLDVSRITRGKIHLDRRPLDIRSLLMRAATSALPAVEAKRQELSLQLGEEPITVSVDEARTLQILENLLTNAVKYTDEGGSIRISSRVSGDTAIIEVSDSGVGIEAAHLPMIFDLFIQVDSTLSRSQGGLGIGLTLVKRLVELHGGTVAARSQGTGKGSTFIIRLPRLVDTAPSPPESPAENPPSSRSLPRKDQSRCERLLVVDDVVDHAIGLVRLLEHEGYDVRVAHDGRRALEVAREFLPGIILLDVGLPEIDGCEVAARLRADPAFAEATLIAISGYGQESDRRRSLAAGFDHHITKPVNMITLEYLIGSRRKVVGSGST